jgi:dienelactone hydrolase
MRTLLFLLVAIPLLAQDRRNLDPANTDTHYSMPSYRSRVEWEARAVQLRKQILSAGGLLPMPPKTPLNPAIFGRIERDGYTVEKVALETMPGYYLGGNLYRPHGKRGKFPGIVSPHGHWKIGRLENSDIGSVPGRAINFARQGFVVFTYDMVGYNDTKQTPHAFGGPREQLWSFGPLGLQLWNSIRAVDFVESLPDVDKSRIAATGASGGGTQTFLLQAVEPRVKVSAPVNMLSFIMQGGSPCENAPGLRIGANNVEFGAIMAPRPMLMVSATGDWTRNTPREEFPAMRGIYELYGHPERVENVHIDAPHNYNRQSREAVYAFFAKHLLEDSDASKYKEQPFTVEAAENLLVWSSREMPKNALNYEQIFQQWVTMAQKQNETRDRSELRERLALSLATEWPAEVTSTQGENGRIMLSRRDRGDRIPAIWKEGSGPTTLVVHENGADAAANMAGEGALLKIDAFQTGAAVAPRQEAKRHHLTFNRSVDAQRVQDILTALRFLERQGARQIRLVGAGRAAVWALFAAAVAPVRVKLEINLGNFTGVDADFERDFFVPGIQRAGGLKAALLLTR